MQRTIALSNGVEMPRVGLGTFKAQGADVQTAVRAALAAGIRHFDTASIYKNQTDIAEALKASGVRRDDVFLTSKVSPFEQGAAKAAQAVDDILSSLGTSYVDLLLVHWPGASRVPPGSPLNAELRGQTWRVLERAYRDGRARAIGVSNYEERHLAELLATAEVRPMVNQIEVHPRRQCAALRAACAEAGVAVVAYASLGCGDLLSKQAVVQVASECCMTPAQVLLRWGLHKGCAVIPKSCRPERIAEASEPQLLPPGAGLTDGQMALLDSLEDGHKYCWDPSGIS